MIQSIREGLVICNGFCERDLYVIIALYEDSVIIEPIDKGAIVAKLLKYQQDRLRYEYREVLKAEQVIYGHS